ncbi:MAG: nucleotidyltransferase domain-containing protein [Nanoarchaeota archaeon]|nr:nucleotidyltransferase domain-containing protein [Nanoarchaeota archaeon]
MLEHLFTSKSRIKILSLLMFNQDKEYHLREIARLVDVSPKYVGKELEKLLKISIVNKYKRGNMSIYSINRDNIILDELKKIFLKTDYLGEMIRKELQDKVAYAFIYGSFAKGEENENSDIDLFIVGSIGEDELIKIVQKLEKTTNREINYVVWNMGTFNQRAKSHHLLKTIKKSKIIMLIGHEDEFKKAIR